MHDASLNKFRPRGSERLGRTRLLNKHLNEVRSPTAVSGTHSSYEADVQERNYHVIGW